ncbi:MAG: hypothetical protein ACOZF0_19880 [Thermodesulfobacteriota bacterium]
MNPKSKGTAYKQARTVSETAFNSVPTTPTTFASLAFRTGSWLLHAWENLLPGMGKRGEEDLGGNPDAGFQDQLLARVIGSRKFGPKIHIR